MALSTSDQWMIRYVDKHYKTTQVGRDVVAPMLRAVQARNVLDLFENHHAEFCCVVDALEEFEWVDEEDRELQFSLDPDDHA